MEALFEPDGTLRFHAEKAAVQSLAATTTWPPCLAAAGYARILRGWQPDKAGEAFNPVPEMQEMDGGRYSHVTFSGKMLVAAEAGPDAKVSLFDTSKPTWSRLQTMEAGGTIECLEAAGDFVSVGRTDGAVRVWRQLQGDVMYKPLFNPDLPVDTLPITQMHLEAVNEGKEVLLVVYSTGKASVGVWRLTDGKILHVWGTNASGEDRDSKAAAGQLSCVLSTLKGGVLGLVFWAEGRQAEIHLMHIVSGEGGRVPPDERLQPGIRPLCASFDGATLAVGFENGSLSSFGKRGWQRWHKGAVGAVQTVAANQRVLSGGADGTVCLWAEDGTKLAEVRMVEAVTALLAGPLYAVAGSARGDVQIIVLPPEVDYEANRPSDRGDEAPQASQVAPYDPWFDSRWKGSGVAKRASEDPEEFRAFVPPQRLYLPDPAALEALALAKKDFQGKDASEAELGSASPSAAYEDEKGGKGSKFDMGAAMKGTQRKPDETTPEGSFTAAKDGRGVGEDAGVARNAGKVVLESNTALIGRKCDNTNCMSREGIGGAVFKRCGACRQVFYCSTHCQRTHWRDGHQKECKKLQQEAATAS